MATVPKNKKRKYMIPFRTSDDEPFQLLQLHASTYEDALRIARCVAGDTAERFLCCNDVEIDG